MDDGKFVVDWGQKDPRIIRGGGKEKIMRQTALVLGFKRYKSVLLPITTRKIQQPTHTKRATDHQTNNEQQTQANKRKAKKKPLLTSIQIQKIPLSLSRS